MQSICAGGLASSQARKPARNDDPLKGRSVFAVDESLPSEIEVIDPRNTLQTPIARQEDELTSRAAHGHQFVSRTEVSQSLARGFTAEDWPRSPALLPRQAIGAEARYKSF